MQGVLAYVFVRPALALIQLLCMYIDAQHWAEDPWGEGKFTFRKWWLWCMLVNNITQVRLTCQRDVQIMQIACIH